MIDVEINNQQALHPVDDVLLTDACRQIVSSAGFERASVSLVVVGDMLMRQLNRQYLEHDYTTDVLSFVLEESKEALTGEIIVCADEAHRQAIQLGTDPLDELLLYVVHGSLHLVGYRDKTDDEVRAMRQAEQHWLKQTGVPSDRIAHLVQPISDPQLSGDTER